MDIKDYIDIYSFLASLEEKVVDRKSYASLRKSYLSPEIVKKAFDTRRIDQNIEFNPRRNLQFYQRSEPYINDNMERKINLFFKVKNAADDLKQEFMGEPDWLDSHTRILCNAVDQILRIEQKDCDYSETQLGYLSELLYARYRLNSDNLLKMSSPEIKTVLFNKDEKLMRRGVFVNYKGGLDKQAVADVKMINNDTLMDKLFTSVKASKENPSVERTVTITISDKLKDEKEETPDINKAG